jgi:hypothetical protein
MYTQSASDLANIQGLLHFWQITSTYEIFFLQFKKSKEMFKLKVFSSAKLSECFEVYYIIPDYSWDSGGFCVCQ